MCERACEFTCQGWLHGGGGRALPLIYQQIWSIHCTWLIHPPSVKCLSQHCCGCMDIELQFDVSVLPLSLSLSLSLSLCVCVCLCVWQTGNQDGFSTLRSHRMVSKQAEEWQMQSELREQMQGYKRMRHQHKHQVGPGWAWSVRVRWGEVFYSLDFINYLTTLRS